MFKNYYTKNAKKGKLLALVGFLALLAVFFPTTVLAANVPAFTSLVVDNTSINAGQTVNFTVSTVGASFVFASVDGTTVAGTLLGTDGAEQTNWSITITPAGSQTITLHANSSNAFEGSSTIVFPITVHGGSANVSTGNQQGSQSGHHILSIAETTAPAPQTVTLTVVTNETPNYVWISGNMGYHLGRLVSQTGTSKTWEITYRPATYVRHQVQISANHHYYLDENVITLPHQVDLIAPYIPQLIADIRRVNASPTTVDDGGRTTITVTTGRDVEYVWGEVDGRRVNARRTGSGATNRTWTFEARPDRTQNIPVFANTTNTSVGAATDSIRITVRDVRPEIIRASLDRNRIYSDEMTFIEVRTNADVEHVWARVNGARVNARRGSTSGNERNWIIDISPSFTQTVTVYANIANTENNAETRNLHITVTPRSNQH